MIHWRDQAISQGKLEQARNHEQTWQALIDLLDEFVAIYGDDPFEQSLFEEVLMTGLENLTFGKIPTAIDQVNINRFDLVRPRQAKITFVPGLNETVLPRRIENKTLLTNEERQHLNQLFAGEKYLRDTIIESSAKEPFLFMRSYCLPRINSICLMHAILIPSKISNCPHIWLVCLNG